MWTIHILTALLTATHKAMTICLGLEVSTNMLDRLHFVVWVTDEYQQI